jgi:CheY-like chemotaxis protein
MSASQDAILVAQASNGREAIQHFRQHRPDITLMDLQMPGMNGVDAMIAIRGEFPEARIIMLTTYTGDTSFLGKLRGRPLDRGHPAVSPDARPGDAGEEQLAKHRLECWAAPE